jgi:imidazole glycerol-phosphate synthase subunit HisH
MIIMSNHYVAIIDYQMSNLFSVEQACKYFGMPAVITADKVVIKKSSAIILPGVGAFGEAMNNIKRLDLQNIIIDQISSGKLFMGICLGMQLLLSESEEFGSQKGFNIIDGVVKKFPLEVEGEKIKIPHIGWNSIYPPEQDIHTWQNTPLQNTKVSEYMYFIHSYYVKPSISTDVLSLTQYEGISYCSGLRKENTFAFQFHPEKSGKEGLKIYKMFFDLIIK